MHSGCSLNEDRIRREGGGRHAELPRHPEWAQAVVSIIEPNKAGLPQDENVIWISLSKTQIQNELTKKGYEISRYHITQILDSLGLRERSFRKDIPMQDVKDRNEQFENIVSIRESAKDVGIPIIASIPRRKSLQATSKEAARFSLMGH